MAVKILDPSVQRINDFISQHKIPQVYEDRQALHSTVIWSRKHCPDLKPEYDVVHRARARDIHVFHSDNKNRLVLMLDAPSLTARHKELMRAHGATYDYPDYHPHVTIAYDIGNYPWWKLPAFHHEIILGDENVRAGNDRTPQIRSPWNRIKKMLSEIA